MPDNRHAGHYVKYGIIYAHFLPDDVEEELSSAAECGNDCGRIMNPDYNDKFKVWLEKEGMPVEPYIIWFSW